MSRHKFIIGNKNNYLGHYQHLLRDTRTAYGKKKQTIRKKRTNKTKNKIGTRKRKGGTMIEKTMNTNDRNPDNESERRFFKLEERFAKISESLGELWGVVLKQKVAMKQLAQVMLQVNPSEDLAVKIDNLNL